LNAVFFPGIRINLILVPANPYKYVHVSVLFP